MTAGRPRIIDTPEEFDKLVDAYLAKCLKSKGKEPICLTGMILALGLHSRESLDLYKTHEGFEDSVERAKFFVEHEYELRLIAGNNAAGSIFALKNFNWKDKFDVDANLSGNVIIQASLLDEKL